MGQAIRCRGLAESETFWQGEQDNLLVADNQTESYQRGDPGRRYALSTFAWGERAKPGRR